MIAVLDYGIGNLRSAEKALVHLGADARLVTDPDVAASAAGVVVPGVGAFGPCANALRRSGMEEVARDAIERGVPFLGICIGFQLLYEASDEAPGVEGLGVLAGAVRPLPAGVKSPQMQWNTVRRVDGIESGLLAGLGPEPWVYFVHSFAPELTEDTVATCDYGGPLVAAAERGSVWGTQFHPEKSGAVGLAVLENFVASCSTGRADRCDSWSTRRRTGLMELFCAIDLRDGRAVRLVQGEFDRQRTYGDPFELARGYVSAGARWLHVVDLDAARTGEPVNRDVVLEISKSVGARIQTGGGIRDEASATGLLDSGIERVVLGTAAQSDPALVESLALGYPGRVVVGLDHRGGGAEVAVRGWEHASGSSLEEALSRLAALELAAVVVTAIERDGSLEGPDLEGLLRVLGSTRHPVIASGGVRSVQDLADIAALEVDGSRPAGAIVGMALVEGLLDVKEAIAACEASG